ncbi:GTP-binding protein [Herpetosiphon giganteus]|uniref:GTP-binding protein n=1 Tax=Herpetosiphon giganteus TaxID=2029754 RepID=UPI00195D8B52|nr:ATP/GTP-binding protein [Herpetosiphon giganteus]MBM7844720.1 signal recognition particle receptor subunit beta [Herpetosiphon giganteus]
MVNYKIVITGAYAAGKSQFIRTVSEIDVVDTDVPVTHTEEKELKHHTTVGLDFGTLTIDAEQRLLLFGTPGQERFDFMWEILAEGCLGYIVLVDSCRPAHFNETIVVLERFAAMTPVPFVVAATKQDLPGALPPTYIRRRLGLPNDIPILACVATDYAAVSDVISTLLDRIDVLAQDSSSSPVTHKEHSHG